MLQTCSVMDRALMKHDMCWTASMTCSPTLCSLIELWLRMFDALSTLPAAPPAAEVVAVVVTK
ncbi:hypothetical protein LINPERPRIM_LOCUS1651 [Linum perenne]